MLSKRIPAQARHLSCLALALAAMLAACTTPAPTDAPISRRAAALLPTDALLLGEQHDAAEHQQIERETVEALAQRGKLAAVALEMAEEGNSTAHLPVDATEAQVQTALSWNDKGWPWAAYGPVVMAAVRAGVPVVGANLKRAHMRDAMADVSLDAQLSDAARAAQQEAVRSGHCNLLPESQIVPMTRIQVARDRAMAQAVVKAKAPGKTVLLVSGAGHSNKLLGVPQHLPTDVSAKAVRMQAGSAADSAPGSFDAVWPTPALPEKDYCAGVRRAS
ncbi:ChaN family lipoprotein [Variovorax saccharolyticus]|uniref:ChaN family lipoprotein n=1 Tax=Variovorax saccharolyticus TaxID=3053516 RepID=UPI002576FC17|nr:MULTISPECIES: ChaN family lipoprotein [unclassified Variovorax]MDM0017377.1 ChaN family lipoprotein [Variovorax sp. J22R187]MDM0026895.1 ChaN family lipoprotein [Variovorax sp. J31P216]